MRPRKPTDYKALHNGPSQRRKPRSLSSTESPPPTSFMEIEASRVAAAEALEAMRQMDNAQEISDDLGEEEEEKEDGAQATDDEAGLDLESISSDLVELQPPPSAQRAPPSPLVSRPKASRSKPQLKMTRMEREAKAIVDVAVGHTSNSEEAEDIEVAAAAVFEKQKAPFLSRVEGDALAWNLYRFKSDVRDKAKSKADEAGCKAVEGTLLATVLTNSKQFKRSYTLDSILDWDTCCKMLKKLQQQSTPGLRVEVQWSWSLLKVSEKEKEPATPGGQFASTQGLSVTEKRKLENRELLNIDKQAKTHSMALIDRWHCDAPTCQSNNLPCLQFDGEHVKLNHQQVIEWSKNINLGNADIEKPHAALWEQLQLTAKATKMKRRIGHRKHRKPISSSGSDSSYRAKKRGSRSNTQPVVIQMPPMPPMAPYPGPYYGQPQPFPIPSTQQQQPALSSPVRSDSSDVDKSLRAYIDWLKMEKKGRDQSLEAAFTLLEEEELDVIQLRRLSLDDLKALGIKLGTAMTLRDHAKDFLKRVI